MQYWQAFHHNKMPESLLSVKENNQTMLLYLECKSRSAQAFLLVEQHKKQLLLGRLLNDRESRHIPSDSFRINTSLFQSAAHFLQ